jgi:hypothetical protein
VAPGPVLVRYYERRQPRRLFAQHLCEQRGALREVAVYLPRQFRQPRGVEDRNLALQALVAGRCGALSGRGRYGATVASHAVLTMPAV